MSDESRKEAILRQQDQAMTIFLLKAERTLDYGSIPSGFTVYRDRTGCWRELPDPARKVV